MTRTSSRPTRRWFLALLSAFALLIAACGNDSGDTEVSGDETGGTTGATDSTDVAILKIGSLQPLTGPLGSLGISTAAGLKAAVEIVNEEGFEVDGQRYEIELIEADTQSDPAVAQREALRLVRDEGVKYIIGAGPTPEAVNVQAVAGQHQVLLLTQSPVVHSTLGDEGVSDPKNKYTFAVGAGLDVSGAIAEGVLQQRDASTMVIIWPSDASQDPYIPSITEAFAGHEVEVLDVIRYDQRSMTDFTTVLTRVKSLGPDIVYLGTGAAVATTVARQMVDIGDVGDYLFGNAAGPSTALGDAIGEPLPFDFGYYTPGAVDPYIEDDAVQAFYERVAAIDSDVPESTLPYAATYYAPLLHLVEALTAAGTVDDVDAVIDAMLDVTVDGPGGVFSYTENHQAMVATAVCQVAAGDVGCVIVPYSD